MLLVLVGQYLCGWKFPNAVMRINEIFFLHSQYQFAAVPLRLMSINVLNVFLFYFQNKVHILMRNKWLSL